MKDVFGLLFESSSNARVFTVDASSSEMLLHAAALCLLDGLLTGGCNLGSFHGTEVFLDFDVVDVDCFLHASTQYGDHSWCRALIESRQEILNES